MTETIVIHRSKGLSGSGFYDSVCGLVDTDHYTTFGDNGTTCVECKKGMSMNRREKQRQESVIKQFEQNSGMSK